MPLHHHPGNRLSPGIAHQDPSASVQLSLSLRYRRLNGRDRSEILLRRDPDVEQDLGTHGHAPPKLREGFLPPDHQGENFKSGHHTVSRRIMIEKDTVPRLFTAQIVSVPEHLFQHVAVPHGGPHKFNFSLFEAEFEPNIAHDCRDDRI